ncbi:MAG: hypothetical protein QOH47_2731 [Sphingomonadales bacterium]|jgi:hypothetical protein|nr:hypothetical protein [Sphingomonadales bacterium]
MIGQALIAAALMGAGPTFAPATVPGEARIRNMSDYIEAVADPQRGVFIRAYDGHWYYARVEGVCPRLTHFARLRFDPSPGGDFDRDSNIRADGWRCQIAAVDPSDGPPRPRRRRH